MTMQGNPRAASNGLAQARDDLWKAIQALLAHGDIPGAAQRLRYAQRELSAVETELRDLARVNGLGAELDALEEDEAAQAALQAGVTPLPPRKPGFCHTGWECINHCGSGPCSRICRVCLRIAGDGTVPCPACPDYAAWTATQMRQRGRTQ